jgi:hypothetical protein
VRHERREGVELLEIIRIDVFLGAAEREIDGVVQRRFARKPNPRPLSMPLWSMFSWKTESSMKRAPIMPAVVWA